MDLKSFFISSTHGKISKDNRSLHFPVIKQIPQNFKIPPSLQNSNMFSVSLADLERSAFAFAMMCLISSVVSLIAGGYGSLAQDEQAIVAASSSALASGNVNIFNPTEIFHVIL